MKTALPYHHLTVTDRDGCAVALTPLPAERTPPWAKAVFQPATTAWDAPVPPKTPYFTPPIPFVIPPPEGSSEPFYSHNHCPAITWCPNGDLLAAWFSTNREQGTEMTILASRLPADADAWQPAAEFFKAPNRNMTGTALFHDVKGTLYHFNGMGPEGAEGWENLVMLVRTSADNGVSWTPPRVISPGAKYQRRNQVIAGTSVTPEGLWLQACDATPGGEGPSALHISRDGGRTWSEPGGDIRGIHAGVVGLKDGRLLALGRAQALDGRMPMSLSADSGQSWTCRPSPFPPISSGQRLVLMRLREGPLLLVSFTDPAHHVQRDAWQGMAFADADGKAFTGYGMFAALSFDEGATWPVRRLVTPGGGEYDGGAWTRRFTASPTEAEPKGYLAATQSPDGVIHLISSRLHYRFNLAWLTAGVSHKPEETDALGDSPDMWGSTNLASAETSERGDWFRESRFALFIHWGLYSQAAGCWKGKAYHCIAEWLMNSARIPVGEYEKLALDFNPVDFDARAVVRLAQEAGMKYIVITAKHHDGFAMFKSQASAYNIVDATPFGRDPIRELADACREGGLKLGFYYSQFQDGEVRRLAPHRRHRRMGHRGGSAVELHRAEVRAVRSVRLLRMLGRGRLFRHRDHHRRTDLDLPGNLHRRRKRSAHAPSRGTHRPS